VATERDGDGDAVLDTDTSGVLEGEPLMLAVRERGGDRLLDTVDDGLADIVRVTLPHAVVDGDDVDDAELLGDTVVAIVALVSDEAVEDADCVVDTVPVTYAVCESSRDRVPDMVTVRDGVEHADVDGEAEAHPDTDDDGETVVDGVADGDTLGDAVPLPETTADGVRRIVAESAAVLEAKTDGLADTEVERELRALMDAVAHVVADGVDDDDDDLDGDADTDGDLESTSDPEAETDAETEPVSDRAPVEVGLVPTERETSADADADGVVETD
jgi:hypothetical protein